MAKRRLFQKEDDRRPPSLYRKETNQRSSFSRNNSRNSQSMDFGKALAGIIIWMRRNPRVIRNIFLIVVVLLAAFLVLSHLPAGNEEVSQTSPSVALIGSNSIGNVYKEGPYGNNDSNVSIAYILGTHPREIIAHDLMEQAFREKADSLNCTYYIYRINVTSNPTDFEESRANGQNLANKYVVPDIINNNFTAAIDVHHSNGYWGVSRFVFTPNENNTVSSDLGHSLADNFTWLSYYVPPDPTSPEYVTGPLNDGGVGAIVYEAYTEDSDNTTLDHDLKVVDFVDKWAYSNFAKAPEKKGFFIF